MREGDWVGDMVVVTASPEGDTTGVCVAATGGGEGEVEAVSPPPRLQLTVTLRDTEGEGDTVPNPLLMADALPEPPPTPPPVGVAKGVLKVLPLIEEVPHTLGLPEEVMVGVGCIEKEGEPEKDSFPKREGLIEGVPLPPPVELPQKESTGVVEEERVEEALITEEAEKVEEVLGDGDKLAPPLNVWDAGVVLDTLPLTTTTVGVEGMDLVTVLRGEREGVWVAPPDPVAVILGVAELKGVGVFVGEGENVGVALCAGVRLGRTEAVLPPPTPVGEDTRDGDALPPEGVPDAVKEGLGDPLLPWLQVPEEEAVVVSVQGGVGVTQLDGVGVPPPFGLAVSEVPTDLDAPKEGVGLPVK